MKNIWSLSIVLIACGTQLGCTTFEGEKLDLADKTPREIKGIPFVLPRPEFTLTRTNAEGEDAPVYNLDLKYEPDSSQVYTLKLDPAIFSDPEFVAKFGANSTLSGTNAKYTEQITPTISAIGSFLTQLASTAAGVAALADADSLRTKVTEAIDAVGEICEAEAEPPVYQIFERYREIGDGAPTTVGETLQERYMVLYETDEQFSQLFVYLNLAERECLELAQNQLASKSAAELSDQATAFKNEKEKHKKDHADEGWVALLDSAVADDSTEAFSRLIGAEAGTDDKSKSRRNLISIAQTASSGPFYGKAADALKNVLSLKTAALRGRQLMNLERMLYLSEIGRIFYPAHASAYEDDKDEIATSIREIIDAPELYERVTLLNRQLQLVSIQAFTVTGEGNAPPPYVQARAELDETLNRIAAKRESIVSPARPEKTKPPAPIKPSRVPIVDKTFISKEAKPEDPEFVIVLEGVD